MADNFYILRIFADVLSNGIIKNRNYINFDLGHLRPHLRSVTKVEIFDKG